MKGIRFYAESYGCQMNAYETEFISARFLELGAEQVADPEKADCILVNTCSVREHAEQRALGRLRELGRYKNAVIAVCGCMAMRLGERLFEVSPAIRIVAGPDSYDGLAASVERAIHAGERFKMLDSDGKTVYEMPVLPMSTRVSRYVSITRGCANFCSYCIVPYLRGPLRSRSKESILKEVSAFYASGAREVTLLGQNVLAYRDGKIDFVSLLEEILEKCDMPRIRFLTSHPRDLRRNLLELMAREKRLCRHIHLPVQSGSDRILKAMNRGYSREEYLSLIEEARSLVPEIGLTSDIIVGFPGETISDFELTLEVVRRARFDAAFTFKYSPRIGTKAAELEDDVSPDEKAVRLRVLNEAVQECRREVLSSQIGKREEILLDGSVLKGETRVWKGRTTQFRNVLVRSGRFDEGAIISVVLKRLVNFTFEGEPVAL